MVEVGDVEKDFGIVVCGGAGGAVLMVCLCAGLS